MVDLNRINEQSHDGVTVAVDVQGPIAGEGIVTAGNAVTPGHIVIKGTAVGEIVHAGAAAENILGWAPDNVLAADEAVGTANDNLTDYAAGERVGFYMNKGDVFWGVLLDGQDINEGDYLKTAAGGKLQAAATADAPAAVKFKYIGKANAAPSGSDLRILVEVI